MPEISTPDTARRKLPFLSVLPMLGHTKGKRSPVTCALKCDNACSGEVCNTSSNTYFRDIASASMSRRAALGFGAAGAVAVVLGGAPGSAETAVADGGPGLSAAAKNGLRSRLQFTAIAPVDAAVDAVTVPEGFTWRPVIRWGDPLFSDAPAFDLSNQTAAAQERQFGYNNDYTDILEIPGSKGRRAVLFTNHEYTNDAIMFLPCPPPTCGPLVPPPMDCPWWSLSARTPANRGRTSRGLHSTAATSIRVSTNSRARRPAPSW
jgi:secreted PhoX family phosphatase